MNSKITKTALMLSLMGLSTQLFAQDSGRFSEKSFRTWSVGVHGGVLSQNTIFNGKERDFQTAKETIGYGGFIKKQVLPSLGIQADFLRGKVEGLRSNTGGLDANGDNTYLSGSSYETKIEWSAALTAIYNIANININKENAILTPYVKAGAGYMSAGASTTNVPLSANESYKERWFVPVGAGFKLGVAKGINLDMGYDVNFVKSDKFDGFNYGGRNDKFSYGHIGLEFALGSKEKPQLQNYSSLANLRAQTKEESDELRRALSTAEQNAARDREQYAKDMGDDDNDGVANKFDKCPGTPSGTVVDGSGCPIKVQREIIKETKVVVTEADRKVVDEAIKNLEFDLGKATIRAKSYATLNKVAALLIEKNFSLKLAGHTDNTGSMALNLRLSKERAESIKAYLVSQGANASRIEATGYGPNQPIASNKTADGRQKNRRVEFTLY
ncbi:OOP family OmpA-OmpF porin [Pedobacter africanus]|uniref:OOP family OmpA-OmpF porin n=1 Tax=Pedobacter africanus TaxID=151894 RepID=A0ACC6KTM7_9SPHI|nr:OmpA family protein [Pedobacter africanus]MDR6782504.1 OOP family OmpA-OmpF porin [Pedobacter africanus]